MTIKHRAAASAVLAVLAAGSAQAQSYGVLPPPAYATQGYDQVYEQCRVGQNTRIVAGALIGGGTGAVVAGTVGGGLVGAALGGFLGGISTHCSIPNSGYAYAPQGYAPAGYPGPAPEAGYGPPPQEGGYPYATGYLPPGGYSAPPVQSGDGYPPGYVGYDAASRGSCGGGCQAPYGY